MAAFFYHSFGIRNCIKNEMQQQINYVLTDYINAYYAKEENDF